MAKIVVIDGPDGVGKSTQLKLAKEALESSGKRVYITRTPGGTPIGEELRKVFLSDVDRPPETDLHIVWGINLAIAHDIKAKAKDFDYILVDRGPFSFMAYQVYGSGLDVDKGRFTAQEIMDSWKPDICLVLMAPVEITRQRLLNEKTKLDFFESKDEAFHGRVLKGYQEAIELFKPVIIDAQPSAEAVHHVVMKHLSAI